MNPASPRVKLTYDDFVLFPDDGKRHELIDGEHFVTPSPNLGHQRVVGALHAAIHVWLRSNPIGEVFVAPFDVLLSNVDVVEPDLLYISNERKRVILTPKHVTGAPELVVEVASPSTRTRDETLKRRLFEQRGVLDTGSSTPSSTRCESISERVKGSVVRLSAPTSVATPCRRLFCRASNCPCRRSFATTVDAPRVTYLSRRVSALLSCTLASPRKWAARHATNPSGRTSTAPVI